jgi:hypothetical protein
MDRQLNSHDTAYGKLLVAFHFTISTNIRFFKDIPSKIRRPEAGGLPAEIRKALTGCRICDY